MRPQVFSTVASFRKWRQEFLHPSASVGFVATMGALHDGHLSLVKRSLRDNTATIVSIFVNPAQFAPHEDLDSYPRTLASDLDALETVYLPNPYHPQPFAVVPTVLVSPDAVFAPSVNEMYPGGIDQDVASQTGTFVEVKGFDQKMEGQSRPTFFRGVATVVTKLFNIIQPTRAYFGQKDIQQALLLRKLSRDLLMPYPEPQNIHIIPTARDPTDNLALSSRNSYLSANGRRFASALPQALEAARGAWDAGASKAQAIQAALDHVNYRHTEAVRSEGLVDDVKVDYIQFNDPESFDELPNDSTTQKNRTVILSGALWVGKTRLIDNIILGDSSRILNSRPVRWEAMLAEGISPSSEYNPATGLRNGELY